MEYNVVSTMTFNEGQELFQTSYFGIPKKVVGCFRFFIQ